MDMDYSVVTAGGRGHKGTKWQRKKIQKRFFLKAVAHLHNGILLGCKKEGYLTFSDSMDGPGEYYAK